MLKLFRQFIVVGLLFPAVILSQTVNSVIVSGWGGQHDEDVKTSFLMGYSSYDNSEFPGNIELYSFELLESFIYAEANNIDLIVRSHSDLGVGLFYAPIYPSVHLVMPSGSNEFILTFTGDVSSSPVIITGAGIDTNLTGYQIEFFSIDPITVNNLSSFSNGYIAGQISFITNTLEISFDSARTLARTHGSFDGRFDFYSGYGKILIDNIIPDPLPVELSSFTAELIDNLVELHWVTQTEVNNYGFEVQRKSIFAENYESEWEQLIFINGNGNSNNPNYYYYRDTEDQNSDRVHYRLKQIDLDGTFEYSDAIMVNLTPLNFELFQNYPNPFNPSTNIKFSLNQPGHVVLKIFSLTGEEIQTLLKEEMIAGFHSIKFDANNLASGIYIYKLDVYSESKSTSSIRKMNFIR
ncbi:T9SS type A sorting domain-containing protein [Bacteroidota bacterium]